MLFCCECAWVEEMSIKYLIECDLRARFEVNHLFLGHMELLSDVIWAISHDELRNYRHQIVSKHFYHCGWENPAGRYCCHHKIFHLLEQIVYLCRAPTWWNNKPSCVWAIWNSFVCGWRAIWNGLSTGIPISIHTHTHTHSPSIPLQTVKVMGASTLRVCEYVYMRKWAHISAHAQQKAPFSSVSSPDQI